MLVGLLGKGFGIFDVFYLRAFSVVTEYTFMAIPLFVFMAIMVEKAGISEQLFKTLYLWMGACAVAGPGDHRHGDDPGGHHGIFSASVVMLGLVALPAMMERKYQKELATGSICAAGCLGILIPPSLMLILTVRCRDLRRKLFIAAIRPASSCPRSTWGTSPSAVTSIRASAPRSPKRRSTPSRFPRRSGYSARRLSRRRS